MGKFLGKSLVRLEGRCGYSVSYDSWVKIFDSDSSLVGRCYWRGSGESKSKGVMRGFLDRRMM